MNSFELESVIPQNYSFLHLTEFYIRIFFDHALRTESRNSYNDNLCFKSRYSTIKHKLGRTILMYTSKKRKENNEMKYTVKHIRNYIHPVLKKKQQRKRVTERKKE